MTDRKLSNIEIEADKIWKEATVLYSDGEYDAALRLMLSFEKVTAKIISLTFNCLIKSNQTSGLMLKFMECLNVFFSQNKDAIDPHLFNVFKADPIYWQILNIESQKKVINSVEGFSDKIDLFISKFQLPKAEENLLVFPVTWPLAYGDFCIYNQFIKKFKKENPEYKILLIAPLNRPELKDLADLNQEIDYICDITLMKEESNRAHTLYLQNPAYEGCFNLAVQELIIERIILGLDLKKKNKKIINLRYFPILSDGLIKRNMVFSFRIWEERARLWLDEQKELPKIMDDYKKDKEDKIVVHFRNAEYGYEARNVTDNQAQSIINALKKEFPTFKIVRLGDKTMSPLLNVDVDLTQENDNVNTIGRQAREIQTAKLFIGCHSAPQQFACAVSDTPIICINYTCQETTTVMNDNIPRLSYEPIGEQVKKIFYTKMFDKNNNELTPTQNNPYVARIEPTPTKELIKEIKKYI